MEEEEDEEDRKNLNGKIHILELYSSDIVNLYLRLYLYLHQLGGNKFSCDINILELLKKITL